MKLTYEEICSNFYAIQDDPKFFTLNKIIAKELMNTWILNGLAVQYINNLFDVLNVSEEIEEIDFTLKNPINDFSDKNFVKSILAQFMKISWLDRMIDSRVNNAFVLGTSEEKKIQSNYKANAERSDSLKTSLRKQIRDYGYQNNDYISS